MDSLNEQAAANLELYAHIPLEIPDYAGYKDVEIRENNQPLVSTGPFSGNDYDRFFTSSVYYGEHKDSPYGRGTLENSLVTMFVREDSARQLLAAESMLPTGLHLVLLDTYRSIEVQQSLYDQYATPLRAQRPDWSEEQVIAETTKYVSQPSVDPTKPSTHNTGGSIDLAIYSLPEDIDNQVNQINAQIQELDETGNWEEIYKLEMARIGLISQHAKLLNFGSQFDWGGPESALNYLEVEATKRQLTAEEEEARQNRRLLYNVMMKSGFQPFKDEWWHYNSTKTQMGAKTGNLPFAEYGPAVLSEVNLAHEQMRRKHISGTEVLQTLSNSQLGSQLKTVGTLAIAQAGQQSLGAPYNTIQFPQAAKISPPEQKAA